MTDSADRPVWHPVSVDEGICGLPHLLFDVPSKFIEPLRVVIKGAYPTLIASHVFLGVSTTTQGIDDVFQLVSKECTGEWVDKDDIRAWHIEQQMGFIKKASAGWERLSDGAKESIAAVLRKMEE